MRSGEVTGTLRLDRRQQCPRLLGQIELERPELGPGRHHLVEWAPEPVFHDQSPRRIGDQQYDHGEEANGGAQRRVDGEPRRARRSSPAQPASRNPAT